MARYRGMITNNIKFDATVKVRRSIDLRELGDFGLITDTTQDLPTAGATHRADKKGSTSATRGYTDLRGIHSDVVVDRQDMGLISDITDGVIRYNNEPYLY